MTKHQARRPPSVNRAAATTITTQCQPVGASTGIDKKLTAAKPEVAENVRLAVVGNLEGLELKHWKTVAAADESRAPFELPADQAAVILIDPTGHIALRETGLVRMYKLVRVSELLGVDLNDRRE